MKNTKRWFHSRMLWVQAIAVIASVVAGVTTKNWIDGEVQVIILAIIDFILRLKTSEGLSK